MPGNAEPALATCLQRLDAATCFEQIQNVVRSAPRLLGAMGGTLVLRDGDECYYADEDAIGPLWKGQRFPIGKCISGWAMRQGKTAVVPDSAHDPRIPQEAYRPTFVRSLVMVPVGHPPVAAIGAYWASARQPDPEEVRALERVAEAAGEAIARVERSDATATIRLARTVLDRTLRIGLRLATADEAFAGEPGAEHLAAARREIDDLIGDARRFVLQGARGDEPLVASTPASPFLLEGSAGSMIQHLPDDPLPGVEARYLFVPALGMPAGGDLGEVVAVDDGHLLLAVGDVSGHGSEVALASWSLRELIHAYAAQGCAPSAILSRCSKWLDFERDGLFATLLCTLVDLPGMELQLASAGHPSLLLLDGVSDDFVALRAGPPVGIEPGCAYATHTVPLTPGATIVAFTDGLVERRGESLDQGFARLRSVAVERRAAGLDELTEGILEHLLPEPGQDDALLLVLRVKE